MKKITKIWILLGIFCCLASTMSPALATTLTVEDEPIGPKISIYKISAFKDKNGNDIKIAGVKFALANNENFNKAIIKTTDNNGMIDFDTELKEGKTYYFKEISVPDQTYQLDTDIHSLTLNSYIPVNKTCSFTYDGKTYTESVQPNNVSLQDVKSDWSNMRFVITIPNTPNRKPFYQKMPITGGYQIILLVAGLVLICIIAVYTVKKKK